MTDAGDRARRAEEHAKALQARLSEVSADIAETEERSAVVYDDLAATRPADADALQARADEAREVAAHERAYSRTHRPDDDSWAPAD